MAGLKDRVTGTLRRQRARRPWLDHLIRAYKQYKDANGDHVAAAITYFSFLALFPLLLLGASVAGFVLASNDELQDRLQKVISDNVPGSLGSTMAEAVQSVIDHRGSIGIIALVGVAYAGLGWVGNLRSGVQIVWAGEVEKENFVKAKLADLLILIGLGLGIVLSIALTSGGTAATNAVVRALHLDGVTGMGTLVAVIGILLALAADTLLFMWMFTRLPGRPIRYRTVLRGALFAAVGYEILKVVGTTYIANVTSNPTYGPLAGVIGLLVWIDLVSRFLLLSAAWTATGPQPVVPGDGPEPEEGFAVPVDGRPRRGIVGPAPAGAAEDARETPTPAAVAGALVGTGALLGAGATAAGTRYLRRRKTPTG
ncbi:MAG TPA: YhjD/YihY/BrkB family envelope integrity protein [Mycobacteriales bacterium]|nr:YhjD/YihY/BrkB family envelope integrity protein [Mycobacteriales bacterium]